MRLSYLPVILTIVDGSTAGKQSVTSCWIPNYNSEIRKTMAIDMHELGLAQALWQ
jgi:hypothetical protein